jgi:hypothetical protein
MRNFLPKHVNGYIIVDSLFTTVITSWFLWIRTNICRLLEFLLLPVTEKIKSWKGSTGRVIQSVSQMHIITVVQTSTSLFVAQATSEKFGLHAGSMRFNTQSEEWISICIIICIVSTCVFCWTSCALKVCTTHNSRKSLNEIQITCC